MRFVAVVCLVLIAILLGAVPARAQEPAREQAFVYGLTNYDGSVYESALVPPSVDTIYLLGGQENVMAPRQTLVYFWPITNQYLADWGQLNELVDGSLQVFQNGQLRTTLPLSSYVIQYDVNDPENTLALYTGEEAQARQAEWQAKLDEYQAGLVTYYRALGDYDALIAKLRDESPTGIIPQDKVPVRPEPPRRPSVLSTAPAQGFVIDLPTGTYEVQVVRADGTVQPNSKKRLVVFDKQKDGTAYSVVPSTRWNLPEQSDEPDSVIYGAPGTTLYLQAFKAGQYNDYEYSHMLNPQDQASQPDRGKWVSFDPETKPRMRIWSGGQVIQEIESQPYLVRQISGGGLGYEVAPFDPETMENPTFNGYTIPLEVAGQDYSVELIDENGNPLPGSQRQVISLNEERSLVPYALASLPLVVGAGVIAWRRRSARTIQVDA
jgi:hypothetical protein